MILLQKQLDDFIDNWQPRDSNFFEIEIDNSLYEIGKIRVKNEDLILEMRDSFDGKNYVYYFELCEKALRDRYDARMALWTQEKEMQNEEYYRSVI